MTFSKEKYTRIKVYAVLISLIIICIISIPVLYLVFRKSQNPLFDLSLLIIGSVVLFVLLFLFFTRKYRKRKKLAGMEFPPVWEAILNKEIYYYSTLNQAEKKLFNQEIRIFLSEKTITGIDTEVDEKCRLLVAASAIIPVFKFPDWEYDRLGEILIYPGDFNRDFEFTKKANILGMVTHNGGVMILSKPSLYRGFRDNRDKANVGFHEFAHKIDGEDGYIDGIPAVITSHKTAREWVALAEKEAEKIKRGQSDINPYALTNRAEFFAVACEYFFENPAAMANKHPELYNILRRIFKQDTRSRFENVFRSMLGSSGKKIGRNSPCPCGSGKKYKHCCLDKKKG